MMILKFVFLGQKCGVEPFKLHGHGFDPCHTNGSCFTRGNEMELHPYDVDATLIFPLIFVRLDEILECK